MGLYNDWILPRILDAVMGLPFITAERQRVLAGVSGDVLEIGFGGGHNLPCYPSAVRRVVAVDPSVASARLARARIDAAPFEVEYLPLEGETLASPDASFDSVVSTFTLCSVSNPGAALAQMRRVLKPGGRLFLIEHGRAPEPNVQRTQDRLNGIQRFFCGGCNLNRDIERLVRDGGFEFQQIDKHYIEGQPRALAYLTSGIASPR